jgi:peptidase MA superfamily protein
VQTDRGRITARRIDLRSDGCDPLAAALPHELTHIVVADHFRDRPLPRWADEGMAVTADTAEKQAGHQRDLFNAIASGERIRLATLLNQDGYHGNAAAFYAQSMSVVSWLIRLESEATFVKFVDRAMEAGYDVALQDFYGVASVEELERRWTYETLNGNTGNSSARSTRKRSLPSKVVSFEG